MKKKFLLTAAVALSGAAHGRVLEINAHEHIVYVHPTPRAQITLYDFGREGGSLTVSLDYSSASSKEIQDVQAKYPEYEMKVMMANADGNLSIEIPEINFSKNVFQRQGQMGPYVNADFVLTAAETKTLKARGASIKDSIKISAPVAVNFTSASLMESYRSGPESCDELSGNTVGSVLRSLNTLRRSRAIQRDETFLKYKEQLLDSCFEINTGGTHSFAQLLSGRVRKLNPADDIVVEIYEQKTKSLEFNLEPGIDFEVRD